LSIKDYDGLRPGMYVSAKVLVERPNVFALPPQALIVSGNQTYCFLYREGSAVKTPVQAGISDGSWTEISRIKVDDPWTKVTGDEPVLLGDLGELTNGQKIRVAEESAQ